MGYTFRDPSLLELALTHRSFHKINNERLEFLGDALLDLHISEALYHHNKDASEGEMTRMRASLVRKESLAELAKNLKLGDFIQLGSGELKSGGHRRASVLADALEAILGAAYLDGGHEVCADLVGRLFQEKLEISVGAANEKDSKTRLQEWLQARKRPLPKYEVIEELGSAQAKHFKIKCSVGDMCESQIAEGDSKRLAEMRAAKLVLAKLEKRASTS